MAQSTATRLAWWPQPFLASMRQRAACPRRRPPPTACLPSPRGAREDRTDITLNLKNLIVRLHGASPEIEVYIAKKGAGVVTAADIEAPADLQNLKIGRAHV